MNQIRPLLGIPNDSKTIENALGILGERSSRCCVLNGAAARTCPPGHSVIICNSVYADEVRITGIKPRILTFNSTVTTA